MRNWRGRGIFNFVSDSGQLLLKYKEEIFAEILKICKAALEIGITQEEIIQTIRGGKTYD